MDQDRTKALCNQIGQAASQGIGRPGSRKTPASPLTITGSLKRDAPDSSALRHSHSQSPSLDPCAHVGVFEIRGHDALGGVTTLHANRGTPALRTSSPRSVHRTLRWTGSTEPILSEHALFFPLSCWTYLQWARSGKCYIYK